jgi:hypothetical protein
VVDGTQGHKGARFSSFSLHSRADSSLSLSPSSPLLPQVRHVFRLLKTALDANRGVEWVLLENVRNWG